LFYLLGIDDTDSPGSASTSDLALALGQHYESLGLATLINLSCHALFDNPSFVGICNNRAVCLVLDAEPQHARDLELGCREFLRRESAPGANPGFALATWTQFDPEVVVWGKTARFTLLDRQDALAIGRHAGLSISGLAGSGCGVIGALAAVGLRFEGSDGWIEWMPGLDALNGVYTSVTLANAVRFDRVETENGKRPALDDRILINARPRPEIRNGNITLLLTAAKRGSDHHWEPLVQKND
jgi:hypothetical protein